MSSDLKFHKKNTTWFQSKQKLQTIKTVIYSFVVNQIKFHCNFKVKHRKYFDAYKSSNCGFDGNQFCNGQSGSTTNILQVFSRNVIVGHDHSIAHLIRSQKQFWITCHDSNVTIVSQVDCKCERAGMICISKTLKQKEFEKFDIFDRCTIGNKRAEQISFFVNMSYFFRNPIKDAGPNVDVCVQKNLANSFGIVVVVIHHKLWMIGDHPTIYVRSAPNPRNDFQINVPKSDPRLNDVFHLTIGIDNRFQLPSRKRITTLYPTIHVHLHSKPHQPNHTPGIIASKRYI